MFELTADLHSENANCELVVIDKMAAKSPAVLHGEGFQRLASSSFQLNTLHVVNVAALCSLLFEPDSFVAILFDFPKNWLSYE